MKTDAKNESWRLMLEELPRGWKKYGVECGAVKRLRGMRDMETLMRVLMVHVGGGVSLRTAVTMARAARWANVSPVALWKRLRAAEGWFHGIVRAWTDGREGPYGQERMHLVDGTHVSEPGPTGSVWRMHYRFTLPALECTEVEITDNKTAEGFRNFTVPAGDWLVADSAYARPPQVAYAVGRKARVIVRVPWKTLPLYDRAGRLLPLLAYGRRLKALGSTEREAWIHVKGEAKSERIAGRVCIMKKSEEAAEASRKRIVRETRKKTGRVPQPDTLEAAGYVILWTNDMASPLEEIFNRYRCRWQIELSFKRMKSLVSISSLPKCDARSARAWLYGKLMMVLWVERLMERGARFSPCISVTPQDLFRACGASKRMARMGVYAEGGADEHPAEAGAGDGTADVASDRTRPRRASTQTHAAT